MAINVHDSWEDADDSRTDEEAVAEDVPGVERLFSSFSSSSGGPIFLGSLSPPPPLGHKKRHGRWNFGSFENWKDTFGFRETPHRI